MTKRSISSGAVLLALALLFIAVTVLANYALRGWRLDLTENRLYTTAPGTDRILKSIKEPINLYFFFSEKTSNQLPQLKSYGIRVRELLEELAARSGGKVRLHVIDPQPFSEEEDRADALGVDGTPVGASGAKLYLGLAGTNSTDGHAAIEFFDPSKEQFLEYDVIKLIYQLANPKKPVLAWVSTLPMEPGFDQQSGQMREPWVIYSEAQQLFDVRPLAPTAAKIDPDVSVLVLVHPKNLSPATQFAIDQFALRGGHIMVFVDPIAEADRSGADPQNPMASMDADKSSSLPQLLTAWGVHFDPTQVVADRDHALSVTMRQGEAPVEHLGVLGFDKASSPPNDVLTAGLSVVTVAPAGPLEPVKGAHTKFEPLLRSSTDSELLPVERFRMLFDPSTLREGFKATGVRYTIAARVTGDVGTAFPAGPPPGVTLPPGQIDLKTSVKPLNLVVFADTDLLSDYLWVHEQSMFGQRLTQAWAGNGDLVLNALDNLAGSADLISVRGRASYARPFERVVRLQRIADDRLRDKAQELQRQLQATEQKLTQLQSAKGADSSALIITPAQEQEIEQFEQEKLQIRKQLRAVRAGLDAEIHRLGNTLKILNIIVMPALFALLALAVAAWRRERRRVRP